MATKVKTTKPKQKLSTSNLMLFTVLIAVVALGIGAYVSKIMIGKLVTGQDLASKQSLAASTLSQNLQTSPVLIQNYQGLSPAIQQKISDSLPITPDVPGLIASLEYIAGTSGVSLKSYTPQAVAAAVSTTGTASATPVTVSGPQPVPGSITIQGSYSSIISFLSNTQLSSRPMVLSNLQMQGSGSAITATAALTTYYQPAASLQLKTGTIK